ncbi:PEP-CTERM sorting domain-containing protein [Massilia sp. ST3]|uniref:PEP-CTERM sorting domain-containing protein n=1 Tax=Massilia sp. ST3 TaxID=2824903 RepID=UPI001B82CB16|nr:PEP-CTERM sorting domain-containing protein [Massilia sp. ST3]MBQ5945989.1 PEP-CTERM sorting domain-containing protein [Massilia sp. ST3]
MKRVPLSITLLLAGLAWGAGAAAQAQSGWELSGRVSHGNLGYTLYDLDPTDGIDPSLSFLPLAAAPEDRKGNLTAAFDLRTPVLGKADKRYGADLAPYSYTFAIENRAGFTASASGRGDPGAARIGIEAWARPSEEGPLSFGYSWIQGDALPFVLSPNTRVSFSSAGSYAADIAAGDFAGQFLTENLLQVYTMGADGQLEGDEHRRMGADMRSVAGGDGFTHAGDFALDVDWYNWEDSQAQGWVGLYSYASIHLLSANVPPPVPEPGVLPMLAAGLAGLAWRTRRRCSPDLSD